MPPFVPITTQVNCPVMDLLCPLISTISYVDFMLGNIGFIKWTTRHINTHLQYLLDEDQPALMLVPVYSHLGLHPPDETNAAQIKGGRAGNCTRRKIGPPESNYHHLAHLPWPQINWPEAQAWAPAAAGGSYSLSVLPFHSRSRWLCVYAEDGDESGRSVGATDGSSQWMTGRTDGMRCDDGGQLKFTLRICSTHPLTRSACNN